MTVNTFQTAWFGVNPFTVEGPSTSGTGVIVPQFRLGHVAYGDAGTEYVYCKYTSVSNLVLQPGIAFTVNDDWTATIASTLGANWITWWKACVKLSRSAFLEVAIIAVTSDRVFVTFAMGSSFRIVWIG